MVYSRDTLFRLISDISFTAGLKQPVTEEEKQEIVQEAIQEVTQPTSLYDLGRINPSAQPLVEVPFGDIKVWVGNFITQETIDTMYNQYKDYIMQEPKRAYSTSWAIQYDPSTLPYIQQDIERIELANIAKEEKEKLITTAFVSLISGGIIGSVLAGSKQPVEEKSMTDKVSVANSPELIETMPNNQKILFVAGAIGILALILIIPGV